MQLRPMKRGDIPVAMQCIKDAYGLEYYRPETYHPEGWETWLNSPYIDLNIIENDEGNAAAVQADFCNELGWFEYGALAALSSERGKGIGDFIAVRNAKNNFDLAKNSDLSIWAIPYSPIISNQSRLYNSIFGGIDAVHQVKDRVIFSVYYGWNEVRAINRIPGYIPEKILPFYEEQTQFIKKNFRRMFNFKQLKNYEFLKTDQPKSKSDWSIHRFFYRLPSQHKTIQIHPIQREFGIEFLEDYGKIIKIIDIDTEHHDLQKFIKKYDCEYACEISINLCSTEAPKILKILEQHDFRYSSLSLGVITLLNDVLVPLKPGTQRFPEDFQTADIVKLTTPGKRKCTLINKFSAKKTDPNVEKYLNVFPHGQIEYIDRIF